MDRRMQHHAIVDQGLKLTKQGPSGKAEHTAATYQWIDFQNQPTLTSQPRRLIAAKSCAEFEHIAICHLGPEEHLTTLVMEVQEEKTVGIVLVHTSDLPACGLQPTPCNEIKVPVVLIRYELGNDLLKVIEDTSVNVLAVILKDSPAAADSVPEYQVFYNPAVATASGTKSGRLFLTNRLVELLYERSTRQPVVMCQNTHNFIGTFDLVNEFEHRITSSYYLYSASKLKKKGKTICSHLRKCVEQNYAADFLYHCLMAHWFQLCSAYHTNDHVLKYCKDCVLKLHTLKASSMKSVFLPFLESQLTITWKSGKELAAELLLMFFEEVYASRHLQQKCQSNRSVADFGISLAAAELSLALKQYLKHTFNPVTFWKTFIQNLDPRQLPWNQELLEEIKEKLDLGPALGLVPNARFDCSNLVLFMEQYRLDSLEKTQKTVFTLYRSLPIETSSFQVIASLTRGYVDNIMHSALSPCHVDTVEQRFFKEGCKLIVAIFEIRNYGSQADPGDALNQGAEEELAKWIEYILMFPFLGIHHNFADYAFKLKKEVPQLLSKVVVQQVINTVSMSLGELDCASFFGLLSKLAFIPEEIVGRFLRAYRPSSSDRVKDPVWKKLFQTILNNNWNSLKKDILVVLKAIAQMAGSQPNRRMNFFLDILTLTQPQNCPLLLSDEDQEQQLSFKKFLVDYLRTARDSLQGQLTRVLIIVDVPGESPLRAALLDIYVEAVKPDSASLLKWEWSPTVHQFTKDLSTELCNQVGKKMMDSQLLGGVRSRTCWRLLLDCCLQLSPSCFSLADPPRITALVNVLLAFSSIWPRKSESPSWCIEVNPEAEMTEDMSKYGAWYSDVLKWLHLIQQSVLDSDCTAGQLKDFEQNYEKLKEISDACGSPLVLSVDDIKTVASRFETTASELTDCLLYYAQGDQKCGYIKNLLASWGVAVDRSLFKVVDDCVTQVERYQKKEGSTVPPSLISFKPDVSLLKARDLHIQIMRWIVPIVENKDFLFYFTAHKSVLFQAYLEMELKKVTETFSHHATRAAPGEVTRAAAADFLDSDDESTEVSQSTLSLEDFNNGLDETRKRLKQLVDLSANLQDVLIIGQERFKSVDVNAELTTVIKFPEFKDYNVEIIRHSLGDMLTLLQYLSVVETIIIVCDQYHMTSCLSDQSFKDLKKQRDELKDSTCLGQLTIGGSSQLKCALEQLMLHTPVKKLQVFDAVEQSEEFFKFIKENKFYTPGGKDSFFQQVALITNQLQCQEYNERVLSHLHVAFQCIVPFTNPDESFKGLLGQLKESDVFISDNWINPIQTVNSNIATIRMWFSKAEGDTIENVTRDLQAIFESGFYKVILGQLPTGASAMAPSFSSKCHFQLEYKLKTPSAHKLTLEKQVSLEGSSNGASIPARKEFPVNRPSLSEQAKGVERWCLGAEIGTQQQQTAESVPTEPSSVQSTTCQLSGEELVDFVQKLGFMQGERDDQQQSWIRNFLKVHDMMLAMFEVCSKLHKFGHRQYRNRQMTFGVKESVENARTTVEKCRLELITWQKSISDVQTRYKELLLFSDQQILNLDQALGDRIFAEVTSIVSALFSNTQSSLTSISDSVSQCYDAMQDTSEHAQLPSSPYELCGKFLYALVKDPAAVHHLYPSRRIYPEDPKSYGHVVHIADTFSSDQVFRLLLQISQGLPESFEVMRCTSVTTTEELDLFLRRTVILEHRVFILVNVNHLGTDLQEQILRFQLDSRTNLSVQVHYVLTGPSIFHNAPWIKVKQYKNQEPNLSYQEAVDMCKSQILKDNGINEVQLVYGRAGDGKSHYIRKQMKTIEGGHCNIAVHEAFSVDRTIQKLQQLTVHQNSCIYFNVTVSQPADLQSGEVQQYSTLMDTFSWFLFDLFVLGFVQDPVTGHSFRLLTEKVQQVYVEIPSVSDHDEGPTSLARFLDNVPCLRYIGTEHHVKASDPLDIDDDTQLVCKYLNALKSGHINRLYTEGRRQVKFSQDPDLSEHKCCQLLNEVMSDHVKNRKIMQQLFVKYMTRRCHVLENAPGFTYNTGRGEVAQTGKRGMTDTRELGSTLLTAMLKEVNSFCDPDIKGDWNQHAHQQLVYDFKSGQASFLFLSLNPEALNQNERRKLEEIGIEIPSLEKLNKRDLLDKYLSSALNVEMDQSQISSSGKIEYKLPIVDKEKYVLTVDYALKMLHIHERRMCGVPVVIEGETGVGKTALIRMLSLLWNQSLKRSRQIEVRRILSLILKRTDNDHSPSVSDSTVQEEIVAAAVRVACCIHVGEKPTLSDVQKVCSVYWQDIRDALLDAAANPSMYILDIDQSLILQAQNKDSSDATARLLDKFLTVKSLDTFYKLSVHAALTPEDIMNFFIPKFQQAEKLLQLTAEQNGKQPPTVAIFLDEINTSSCMGLFKELLVDRIMDGSPIPSNVFLIAACNPHRGSSVPIRVSSEHNDWVLGSYYVRPLPPTLRFLTWDYGALDKDQEEGYIREKMAMDKKGGVISKQVLYHTRLIVKCQSMMRKFACEQLCHVGFTPDEAKIRARSCVSQRDIQRVFTLTAFFEESFAKERPPQLDGSITRWAIYASLGIVYYLRLDDKYREIFCDKLKKSFEQGISDSSFFEVFAKTMDFYVAKMHIPVGIAKTRTLKENLFATVICTTCRLPLIIVGAPGSSKTLSFNLALSNLKGAESRSSFFRDTRFPALDPYHYQCSRRSTSLEIENVFKRAVKRQQSHNSSKLLINCVVFMDEAGLPEESHESLKVLHYYLDDPQVSFVAITNHILDAAKSNRAISLFRPQMDEEDLSTLARGCLCADPANPPPQLRKIVEVIDKLCLAYVSVMENKEFKKFFGLRDFIHFVGYIRRHLGDSTELAPDLVLRALERNFNGVGPEKFKCIAHRFLSRIGHDSTELKFRNTVEVLQESLADLSLAQSGSNDGLEAEVRYKLIFDTSKDGSMTRLLFMHGVLDQQSTRSFTCSDFPGDGDIQKVHVISAIKHAAMEGRTVILSQTDDINECFYDLFNQHFRKIDDTNFENGRRYYANIAIGSHSKPCRIDPKFQCIVHMHQSEIKDAPAPFLNRFEKFLVSQSDLLQIALTALPRSINKIMSVSMEKGNRFLEMLGKENVYGATEHTVQSVFLELLPPPRHLEGNPVSLTEIRTESADSQISEESEDTDDSIDESLWDQKAPVVLAALEDALRDHMGFRIPQRSVEDRRFQTAAIFEAVLQLFDEWGKQACRRELMKDCRCIWSWLVEGLLHLEMFLGTTVHSVESVALQHASFAVALFVQWTVFHVCCCLLKITAPESLILKCGQIPWQYVLEYLSKQTHFGLKKMISQAQQMPCVCLSSLKPTVSKVICFTRTTSTIHRLPSSYQCGLPASADSHPIEVVKEVLSDDLISGLMLVKLESVWMLETITSSLDNFMADNSKSLFVVVANMLNCNQRRINHVRSMIEQRESSAELANMVITKHFIILLHFPPSLGHTKPCYPALLLHGWEHVYLDSIDAVGITNPVDVCQWMQMSCAKASEQLHIKISDGYTSTQLEQYPKQLREVLIDLLPQAVNVAVSRIRFGDSKDCYLNKRMDARKRTEILLQLLHDSPALSEALCDKFAKAWDPTAVGEQLAMAVHSTLGQESCLTVSERIQTRFRTLFYNYVSFSLFQLNTDYNLEILFDKSDDASAAKSLFLEIFKILPAPELDELQLQNYTFDSQLLIQCQHQCPVFPFFKLVTEEIEQILENVVVEINSKATSDFDELPLEDVVKGTQELKDIENNATVQLLELLNEPVLTEANTNLSIVQLAFQSIRESQSLWERYLADFARVKLNCYLGQHGSQEYQLLSAWLRVLETSVPEKCFVLLHTTIRFHQTTMRSALAALRPLEFLEGLHPDIKPSNITIVTESGQKLEEQQLAYFINIMYGYLENMLSLSSCHQPSLVDQFRRWCNVYQNLNAVVPITTPYQAKHTFVWSKLQAIHVVFAFVKAIGLENTRAASPAFDLAHEIVNTCNSQAESSFDTLSLPLSSVIAKGLAYLCRSYGFEVEVGQMTADQSAGMDAFLNSAGAFIEDIFAFYFPAISKGVGLSYSKRDCSWLMKMVNSQNHWSVNVEENSIEKGHLVCQGLAMEESVSTDYIPVGLVHFKIIQDSLTQLLLESNNTDRKTGFSSTIREKVGRVLCEGLVSHVRPFVPPYYPNAKTTSSPCMCQPLASVYFHCCLNQLSIKYAKTDLTALLCELDEYDKEMQSADAPKLAVLEIEKQALTQIVIRRFSKRFNPEVIKKMQSLLFSCVIDQVNQLFKDEDETFGSGHVLTFLHYLSQHLKSTETFMSIFMEHYSAFCSPFPWMQSIAHKLEAGFSPEAWQALNETDPKVIDEKIWQQHPLLMDIRAFSSSYPVEPTYKDFLGSLEYVQRANRFRLSVLCKFVKEKQQLRIGGLLLPYLVEFYLWLHRSLSHLMTLEQARSLSVGDVVDRLANRYSKKYARYIRSLFKRVQENYNKYMELCDVPRDSKCEHPIDWKTTKLDQLVSGTEGPDALFLVIRMLVTTQNDFLQAVIANDTVSRTGDDDRSEHVPARQGAVSAFELGWHNCLIGDITPEELQPYLNREVDSLGDDHGATFMRIIRRRHLYVPAADLPTSSLEGEGSMPAVMFEFHRLQQDVVAQFIAGKPFIMDPAQIRIVFRYRKQHIEQLHPSMQSDNTDLSTLDQELPNEFKSELPPASVKQLDILFHNLNYRDSIDVNKALRAVAGHLCQAVMEVRETAKETVSEKCEELAKLNIETFLRGVYDESTWSPELGTRIGLPVLSNQQCQKLLQTLLAYLYQTLSIFVSRFCDGEYEFAHLPFTLKTPLSVEGLEAINKLPEAYAEKGQASARVEGLKLFDKTLLHSERYLEQEAKKSLSAYLVQKGFYDAASLPVCCLPEDIRVEHYMHVRLVIYRIIKQLQENNTVACQGDTQQWSDTVTCLLDEFPRLDYRPGSQKKPLATQPPVFELGRNGKLRHPMWFELAPSTRGGDDSDGSYEESESELAEQPQSSKDEEFSLGQVQVHIAPTLQSEHTTLKADEDSFAILQASGSDSNEWETVSVEEKAKDNDNRFLPIFGQIPLSRNLQVQLQEAATEVDPSTPTRTENLSQLIKMWSPEEKEMIREHLSLHHKKGKDLSFMSVDDVGHFLESHGYHQYVESFKTHKVDGGVMQDLDRDCLKELEVGALDTVKILGLIKQEKERGN